MLTENSNKLLKEGIGKGKMITPNRESVDLGKIIGKYCEPETGKYYNTTKGIIHYDSKGNAHIVPAKT